MKKCLFILFALALLAGCGIQYPDAAADGTPWDESWEMLGSTLGVEEPGNGFTLLDNNAILTTDDTYLATWISGEPIPYVNADGDDSTVYEAQLFLLLLGCKDAENAQAAVDAWMTREGESYNILETRTETYNGQEYTVLLYESASETNPYARGASAFGIFGNYAVNAEVTCLDEYTGDETAILADFLTGCHYSSANGQ